MAVIFAGIYFMRVFSRFRQEWFLFFLPAFFVVHGFARYPEAVDWRDAVLLFIGYGAAALVLVSLFQRFLPFRKAAVFVFVLFLFNGVFGSLYEPLIKRWPGYFFTRMVFVLPFVVLLFTLLFWYLKKTRHSFKQTVVYLNLLFVSLLAIEVFSLTQKVTQHNNRMVATTACSTCSMPDVYLLVTDGYGGETQLRQYLKFDNKPFYDSLRHYGFQLADSSLANYSSTSRSIAALLNMTYDKGTEGEDAHFAINRNSVTDFFQKQGYRTINHSIFKLDDQYPRQPIIYFPIGIRLITSFTFLGYVERFVAAAFNIRTSNATLAMMQGWTEAERKRDAVTMQNLLKDAGNNIAPKFVYAHFLMPHPPFNFDSAGRYADATAGKEAQYVSYLQYANKELLKAVRSILDRASKPPIIVLVSDHGYRDDDRAGPTPLWYSNLVAVYLPGRQAGNFYRGMSNVNLFRVILNQQFHRQLPLLPDSTVQ